MAQLLGGALSLLPGGSASASAAGAEVTIGLWAEFGRIAVPDNVRRVQSAGFARPGHGAASYIRDPDQRAPGGPSAYRKRDAKGIWFRLAADQALSLAMFGGDAELPDNAPAFAAAIAFGVFPVRIEPRNRPYRFVPAGNGPSHSLLLPSGASFDARGAELHFDATGLTGDRFAFWIADNSRKMAWIGGKMTMAPTGATYWIGGGAGAAHIRIEQVVDSTRGAVFTATPIASGTAAAIKSVDTAKSMFAVTAHGLKAGELISLYRADGQNNLYVGLDTHRDYYAIPKGADLFQVAETEALARAGTYVRFHARDGRPPDRIRKGLIAADLLEIDGYRCEGSGCGPHIFGMWRRVHVSRLSGYTTSVQLLQFERPGGGNWLTWGHPISAVAEDISVEASGLGGIEATHVHEAVFRRVRIRNANRRIDGTLIGYKPENPAEQVAYAGVSIGARTRKLLLEDVEVTGSSALSNNGARARWRAPQSVAGIMLHNPSGDITLTRITGVQNSQCDVAIVQSSGDGYTNRIRPADRITLRQCRLRSATPVTASPPHALPPIHAEDVTDASGRQLGPARSPAFLRGEVPGTNAKLVEWLRFAAISADAADNRYGAGCTRYRGDPDRFAHASLPLGGTAPANGFIHLYVAVKFNRGKYTAPPTFVASWDGNPDEIYPFQGVTIGEFELDTWIMARTVVPARAARERLRLYPHYAQNAPVVADPDWYMKFGGIWALPSASFFAPLPQDSPPAGL